MIRDLHAGCRSLLRSPLFTLTAAGSLTLGIGACTLIFSVVYALLLRPLPYPHPEELVSLGMQNPMLGEASATDGVPPVILNQLRSDAEVGFKALGGFCYDYANLTGVPNPAQLLVGQVSSAYFKVFEVHARLGRTFDAADCRSSSPATVILSSALWRSHCQSDPNIIGRTITIGDQKREVIGVMSPEFKDLSNNCDVWIPLPEDGKVMSAASNQTLIAVGRLTGGERALPALRAKLETLNPALKQLDPVHFKDALLTVKPLREVTMDGGTTHALWLLLGAVGCLLLVTCANVANLQLVRGGARRREVGVRLALGASRWRILRLYLAESLLLAVTGGGIGVLAAWWGIDLVTAMLPAGSSPFQDDISLNWPVLEFALVVSGLTGVVTGLFPAWSASRQDPTGSLGAGGRGASEDSSGKRARAVLVVAEIVLALVLLAGAGLMGRSFLATLQTSAGLRTERTLMLNLSISDKIYKDALQRSSYVGRMLESIGEAPGVAGVGLSTTEPFNWLIPMPFLLPGQTAGAPETAQQSAAYDAVNPAFFSTLNIPILKGRALSDRDTLDAPLVVVVNETFAKRFFPGGGAIGQQLSQVGTRTPVRMEIVGIAGDVRRNGLDKAPPPQLYVSAFQRPQGYATVFVRAAGSLSAESLTKEVQASIWRVDPDQPIGKVTTLSRAVAGSMASGRLYVVLFGAFAVMALLLAVMGIYGTVAYSVSQRTRELGIRLALGAQQQDILRLVLGQGMTLVAVGLAIGLVATAVLSHLLANLLYGVKANDPATLIGVTLVLGAAALAASYLPARRAMLVDPLEALREE